MALPLQCSLLQNPSLSPPSPSSSSQSHLLLLCDFVRGCRILRSYHISLRRNISSTVFCSVSGDRNLGPSASSAKRTSTEKEWSQPEPASPSETGTAARARSSIETISLGIKDPVYEVQRRNENDGGKSLNNGNILSEIGVKVVHIMASIETALVGGLFEYRTGLPHCTSWMTSHHLFAISMMLKCLRPRDIRSVDPSLWLMNSMPSLLVREQAILLNFGSLRAIAMQERVLVFDYNRKGGKAFLESLLPRLNPKSMNGVPCMPFELENKLNNLIMLMDLLVEAALISRIQGLEQRLMDIEPNVEALLKVLPVRLTADVLEQLRLSKQNLVELGSRAGALKQMLLDLLEDPNEIRRICIMGRNCTINKGNYELECSVPIEKQIAEEEEEEIEMLLENYLQRCESCHGHAERLLDSAREMEDSIAVNLSSRRLEVSRVELLLQVGTFCVAVGALVAGIFGMNLKSYLEQHVWAFWLTTAGIIVGGVVAFFIIYIYLRERRIL